MVFHGHVANGSVVLPQPLPLPNGTPVRVETDDPSLVSFWESCSLDELARRQGLFGARPVEEIGGGWPDDEIEDCFETIVAKWRASELERAP